MRYMPSRNPAQSGGGQPGNRGEGDPVNGYPFGSTTPGYIDYRDIEANGPFYPGTTRQRYQDDPNARKLHTPGSDRQSQVDKYFGREDRYGKKRPEEPWSWTAEDEANDQAAQAQRRADDDAGWRKRGYAGSDWWKSDPEYQQLLASGNEKGAYRRKDALLSKAKDDIALKAFIAQGGTEETYRNRFNRDWPKPRSPLGAYSHGPGSADWDTRFTNPVPPNTAGGGRSGGGGGGVRRGATPQNAPMSEGVPPSANPMMQGYGQGIVSGGQGGQFGSAGGNPNFVAPGMYNRMEYGGGYNPGQSKSGMGQSPYGGGPQMSTGGNPGMYYNNRMEYGNSSMYGGGQMSMEGRGGGFLPPGFGGGGRQPIDPGSYNPQPFNPYQPRQFNPQPAPFSPQGGGQWGNMQAGYAPFDQGQFAMPYDQYSGMGYW